MEGIGFHVQVACIWEATARKPGNVHRYRDFDDATYLDFLTSAAAIAPVLETACERRVGVGKAGSARGGDSRGVLGGWGAPGEWAVGTVCGDLSRAG